MALFFEETKQPFGFMWTFSILEGSTGSLCKDKPLGLEFSAHTSSNQPHRAGACKMPDRIVEIPHSIASNQETSFTMKEVLEGTLVLPIHWPRWNFLGTAQQAKSFTI